MGAGLQQVEQVIRLLEPAGGVGEVDAAVLGDVQVVGEAEGHAVGFAGQHTDVALRVDAQQALVGIADDQVAGGVEVHAQRAAAGFDEGFHLALVVEAHDAAIVQPGVEAALAVDGGVFRSVYLALGDQLGLHQGVVGLQYAGHRWGLGRVPGQRVDGGGRDSKVDRHGGDQQGEHAQQLLHLLVSVEVG
ncbi:hypothetical protein D9M69_429490 [compost metagenome]